MATKRKPAAKARTRTRAAMTVHVNGNAVTGAPQRGEHLDDFVARVAADAGLGSINLLVDGRSVEPGDAVLEQLASRFTGTIEVQQADVVGGL